MKIKQEASGWPSDVVTDTEKDNIFKIFTKEKKFILIKMKLQILR